MPKNVLKKVNTNQLFKDISNLIEQAKSNVQRQVNSELIILNWNIGKSIKSEILKNKRAEYGERVIDELSQSLSMEYGRGFGRRNLFNMVKLFEVFPDKKIVQSLIAQLSWTHLIEIMHIENDLKREFYITLSINEGWSVRVLKNRIGSMLYERTAISRKPEKTIVNDLKALRENKEMSKDLALRDPYVLEVRCNSNINILGKTKRILKRRYLNHPINLKLKSVGENSILGKQWLRQNP